MGRMSNPFTTRKHPEGFFKSNTNPTTGEHFRGGKGNFYEGGLRVAYMVRWPGKIAPGSTSDHLGYFPDVMPTLAELVDTTTPNECDGISFLPTLLGEGEQKTHKYLNWEFRQQIAVREGTWKLFRKNLKSPVELYDLAKDLGELNNVASDHPEVVARLLAYSQESHSPDLTGKVLDKSLGFKGHKAK